MIISLNIKLKDLFVKIQPIKTNNIVNSLKIIKQKIIKKEIISNILRKYFKKEMIFKITILAKIVIY